MTVLRQFQEVFLPAMLRDFNVFKAVKGEILHHLNYSYNFTTIYDQGFTQPLDEKST